MQSEQLLKSRIFTIQRLTYRSHSGHEIEKDVVRHPGSVAIVPMFADGRVCLIKNYRVSVDRTLIEIPAGTMEPPEPPLDCAHRELIEETGFRAGKLQHLTSFFPAPGILDEEMHLFLATELTAGDPAREVGEEIENFIVTLDEAKSLIAKGEICDAKTILGVLSVEHSNEG